MNTVNENEYSYSCLYSQDYQGESKSRIQGLPLKSQHCGAQDKEHVWLPYSAFNKHTYIFLCIKYEGWNFNSGNYLFTTDTK